MANMNGLKSPATRDRLMEDPTIDLECTPDLANGPIPNPPERYGEPLSRTWVPMFKRTMRTPTRRLRVVVIGAGFSAMNLAYKIYHQHKELLGDFCELCIYESRDEIGGTWLVNTYPGVACDVPAHIYTFPFEPNPDWSAFYASGQEILEYFRRTVTKYDLARDVKCGHRVSSATFDETNGKWTLGVQAKDGMLTDQCDVFVSAVGFLSKWSWPSIPGLHSFDGQLCHSASWADIDWKDKRVGVIGNGSSAIQIVPRVATGAQHLTNFIRNPTYITPTLGAAIIGGQTQYNYSEDERREFREDPEKLKSYRKLIQDGSNRAFNMLVKDSNAQSEGKESVTKMMKDKLGGDEVLASYLTPEYEVGCRRATPGPGYLEAFTKPNVSLVNKRIIGIEPQGIRTGDGQLHELDTLICATGFDVSHRPSFPLIGRNGLSLDEAWKDEPMAYLSLCCSGFPNFFTFTGPNAPVGHGSLMASLGWAADYICKWLYKMGTEDVRFIDVRSDAQEEFNTYADEVMQSYVWSGGCHSWYKGHRTDGRVTAVWAGSVLGFHDMIQDIRPEDFEIVHRTRNRFRFMGNGRIAREYEPDSDLSWFLDDAAHPNYHKLSVNGTNGA